MNKRVESYIEIYSRVRDAVNKGHCSPKLASMIKFRHLINSSWIEILSDIKRQCGFCFKYYGKENCPFGVCTLGNPPCFRQLPLQRIRETRTEAGARKYLWRCFEYIANMDDNIVE